MPENTPEKEKNISGGTPRLPFNLRLRSTKSAKNTMARLAKSFAKGEISEEVFKTLIYFMQQYLGYLKQEDNIDLLCRIEAIERILAKPKGKGGLKAC